jgi:hypothetical protein
MRGRVVPVRDLPERDIEAWQELGRRAAEPNPLFEPACVVPAARHLAGGRDIALVVAEAGGELYGAMPVRVQPRWHRVPVSTATSDVRRMTYAGTPLVDTERGAAALGAMLAALSRSQPTAGAAVAELRWVHAGGPVHRALSEVLRHGWTSYATERFDRPSVLRRPEPSYDDQFNSKYRGVLARRRRQLGKELGGEVAVVDRGGSARAVEDLITMEDRGYKGRTGVSLTSVPGEPRWFREMCAGFAATGRLQVLALEAGGRTAAMQLSVRAAEGLFALKVVYDEDLSRFGPGVALQVGSIGHFHRETDAEWIDSCTYAGNQLLLRLYPDRRPIATYLVALGRTGSGFVKVLPYLYGARERYRSRGDAHRAGLRATT